MAEVIGQMLFTALGGMLFTALCGYLLGRIHESEVMTRRMMRGGDK